MDFNKCWLAGRVIWRSDFSGGLHFLRFLVSDRDQSPSACRTICGYNVPALLSFRQATHFVLTLTNTELVFITCRYRTDFLQTLEGYLSAQLEIYRSHSKANGDDPDSDDHDPDVYEDAERPGIENDCGGKTYNCPLKDCDRNESFKTRQRLRRHFEQRSPLSSSSKRDS